MEDILAFVQFLHPGGEHVPDSDIGKSWNRGEHKRTFVKHPGRYVIPGEQATHADELGFWCEWEPEAKVIHHNPTAERGCPKYIYEPYYGLPESYQGLQNTDPFVFGDQFYYTWCKQKTNHGGSSTLLTRLDIGSLILFGSRVDWKFVLDAVFVVERWIDHRRENYKQVLKNQIPQAYADITIAPAYQEPFPGSKVCGSSRVDPDFDGDNCGPGLFPNRLYFGAMYDQPDKEMFSFFPCAPYAERPEGFRRPEINLSEVNHLLKQNFRPTEMTSLTAMKTLWDSVVQQVADQGLMLGVWAAMPDRRDSTGTNT
ncbi:MAG: hypothetical protein JOZ51_25340 [Chloroflexi bacterium]|nr:hypothetical protein [Chloroflexota bacterium]